MGLLFVESLPGPKVFKCKFCGVDSASPDAIVSKEFRGRHGRAYLFDSEKAYSEDQKYKEGKYILEKHMMLKEGW
ncbi:hypothetical protein E2562_025057 [Oryza meyeriana var. granulata]|uniref:Yippee domain-containing protein n=1 Tax=Oryza meyeriana var. granulata TaxID=110450 RepID=A0A6G1D7V4_9ORYZ|nr:hypothetical protein E2562_025057 [Oryza meyeriana var. granulata]